MPLLPPKKLALLCSAGLILVVLLASSNPSTTSTLTSHISQYVPVALTPANSNSNTSPLIVPAPAARPITQINAQQQAAEQVRLAYRIKLESTTSPSTYQHSPTLTFDRIYVVSLPSRTDRRETMSRIAKALGLTLTFIDATPKDAPVIAWIGERVLEVRKRKRTALEKALGQPANEIGGMGIGSVWLSRPGSQGASGTLELPSLADDIRWGGKDWVAYMREQESLRLADPKLKDVLKPNNPKFNLTAKLWDPLERIDARQILPAVLATWHSHMKAVQTMQANGDASALVLEDDVDIEWDVERMWAAVHRRLPSNWEMAFLGHCWSREMSRTCDPLLSIA